MRSLIVLGVAASLLTVAACNRTDDTPTETEAAAAADAAAETAAAGSTGAARSSGAATPGDTATPYPTNDPMPPATDAGSGGSGASSVSDATRDGAKEKAESTNLHPRTP